MLNRCACMRMAVFMERDGVLNRVQTRGKNPVSPLTLEEFQVNEEAIMPLRQLKAAGFLLVVTTNQPELSRSHLNRREMDRMQLESPWLRTGHHDMVLPDLAAAAQWIGEVLSPVPQPLATCG